MRNRGRAPKAWKSGKRNNEEVENGFWYFGKGDTSFLATSAGSSRDLIDSRVSCKTLAQSCTDSPWYRTSIQVQNELTAWCVQYATLDMPAL